MLQSFESHKDLINFVAVGDYSGVERRLTKLRWDPNVSNEDKVTPAHKAAERNDLKMLQLLYSAGARMDVTDAFGTTPLFYAKENHNASMIEFITKTLSQAKQKNGFDKK